jgi:hypothetical protein
MQEICANLCQQRASLRLANVSHLPRGILPLIQFLIEEMDIIKE